MKTTRFVGSVCLVLTVALSTQLASARVDRVTQGRLDAIGAGGSSLGVCPLKHTDVRVEVAGFVARVTVRQQFHNPFKDKIEAIYTFPLSQDAAVDHMTMKVGDRLIVGEIKKRDEARQIYETAKAAGHVATRLGDSATSSSQSASGGSGATGASGFAHKLNCKLRDLAEKVAKEGKDGDLTVDGIEVNRGRVLVRVQVMSFHDESLASLSRLGFQEVSRDHRPDSVIGTIDVSRLDDLARLEVVVYVEPETHLSQP